MNKKRYILVLNTAEGFIQLVLGSFLPSDAESQLSEAQILCTQKWQLPGQGAELLAPILKSSCQRLKIKPSEIKAIACVNGPGSFTGIRLALSSAAALARSNKARQAAIPYLSLLAENALELLKNILPLKGSPMFFCLSHARRKLVHLQSFKLLQQEVATDPILTGPILKEQSTVQVLNIEEAATLIKSCQSSIVLGSGLSKNIEKFKELLAENLANNKSIFLDSSFDSPRADCLFRLATSLHFTNEDIAPCYTRGCDAEESLEKIAVSLGLESDKAKKALETFQNSEPTA